MTKEPIRESLPPDSRRMRLLTPTTKHGEWSSRTRKTEKANVWTTKLHSPSIPLDFSGMKIMKIHPSTGHV